MLTGKTPRKLALRAFESRLLTHKIPASSFELRLLYFYAEMRHLLRSEGIGR